jgi:PPK2 family polyphosphate:nucleotide phosphotransferase
MHCASAADAIVGAPAKKPARMKIDTKRFRVEGGKADLGKRPTRVPDLYSSDDEYDALLSERRSRLHEQQEMLFASGNQALLIVLQGTDTSGKDGLIEHVMSGINPQGCTVHNFKQPSSEELRHDFLWRIHKCVPERGRIGIFNRSHYEDVVVVRVHPEWLASAGFDPAMGGQKAFWKMRFDSIREFEQHLHRTGTRIVKIFLHLSREEQAERLLARIAEPEKNWKFNSGDVKEREFWPAYVEAYEDAIGATSANHAPWFVVPADDKKNARLIVSEIVADALEELKPAWPTTSASRAEELKAARKALEAEKLIRD